MKKFHQIFCLTVLALSVPAIMYANPSMRTRTHKTASSKTTTSKTVTTSPAKSNKTETAFQTIRQQYTSGKISADSVIDLALYHKAGNPELAERILKLASDKSPKANMELGALYVFTPQFASQKTNGVRLLEKAAQSGENGANCYLGLYYFNQKDYKKAKSYFDACHPMDYGVGFTALGSMYSTGSGVKQDLVKARENFHQAALKGYARGMALYGFNLRANAGGKIDYPQSFFWLYTAGDLGDDAARATLGLPLRGENRGDSEVSRDALTALQLIQAAESGKKIQHDPLYKEGFLPGLKDQEKAAEQGDDWARFYLGSMNFNGDFLNQNFARALYYYEPIARNGKLPAPLLALVHQRLARLYTEGRSIKPDASKAARHTRMAAHYGSLSAYKSIENLSK